MQETLGTNNEIQRALEIIRAAESAMARPLIIALDGRSGVGKTSIGEYFAAVERGEHIRTDDFWIGGDSAYWDQLSPEDRADKAIDWQRLRREVLEPLHRGEVATWHPFNWATGSGLSPTILYANPKKLIVVDGAYSARPELRDLIDLCILVAIDNDGLRRERLVSREGLEYMQDWHGRWDLAEEYYFNHVVPRETFDLIIHNDLMR